MYEWTIRCVVGCEGFIDHTVYADTSEEALKKVLKATGAGELKVVRRRGKRR
jgi:hypothetical protein